MIQELCDGIMPAATRGFTSVLENSIWLNLEILIDGSLFAGITDSSEDLSSDWILLIDAGIKIALVEIGVAGIVAEYTWSCVNWYLSMKFLATGYIPHFLIPVLIKAVDSYSHASLKSFVKFVLLQFTGFFHPSMVFSIQVWQVWHDVLIEKSVTFLDRILPHQEVEINIWSCVTTNNKSECC